MMPIAPDSLPPETFDQVYRRLFRALRRKKGFGLFFVVQSDYRQVSQIIEQLRRDLPQKKISLLSIKRETQKVYDQIAELREQEGFDILVIRGIEQALYEYEDTKRLSGWSSTEIYTYSWKGVPPILSHLNQQRERFGTDFSCSFVFVVPSFVLNYFIQRAPDFFDWRSGLFHFPLTEEERQVRLEQLSIGDLQEYLKLTPEERVIKTLELNDLLDESSNSPETTANLHFEHGLLFLSGNNYEKAIASYDQAIALNSDNYKAWFIRGITLGNLERYEEAIASFDQCIALVPDDYAAWFIRGITLGNLERYEEAVAIFDKAIDLNSDDYAAWFIRGITLSNLERYEEAIASFDQAIALNPDFYQAWFIRGNALDDLERYEEAIASYDQAIALNPDDYKAWFVRGNALDDLERYEEAIASFDQAIALNPDNYQAWNNRGAALGKLERYGEAIEAFKQAIYIEPKFTSAYNSLSRIYYDQGCCKLAIDNLIRATKTNPRGDSVLWNNLGFLYLIQNKPKKAKSCLHRSLQMQRNSFLPIFNLALVHVISKKFKEAKRLIQKSLTCCQGEDTQEKLYIAIGTIALGQKQDGLQNLQDILSTLTHPSRFGVIRGGVLESAELLARYPAQFPGIDQALAMLKQTLQ
ncbi:MAG: tetratricopeptide repeat protein [Coleofasciculus sp. A1-SPW-01]|uniref:tetratricopeptide repeat protein n=1 Tax=Coleofasciculus sp. A1-SPW-01 TaxID=3070819 RepID=UPI003303BAB7